MRLRRIIPRFSLRTLAVFLLLVTSGVGLWWHWEAWHQFATVNVPASIKGVRLSSDYRVLEVWCEPSYEGDIVYSDDVQSPFRARWALPSGKLLGREDAEAYAAPAWDHAGDPAADPELIRDPDRNAEWLPGTGDLEITDAVNGAQLARFDGKAATRYRFANGGTALMLVAEDRRTIVVYRRRRPEWWWGVFWLWEFWVTAFFAGVFVWSVWRDRRSLRVKEQPTE